MEALVLLDLDCPLDSIRIYAAVSTVEEKRMIDEGVAKLRVRRFSGLFWPIFRFFSGGNIRNVDITPLKKNGKSAQKNPKIDRT